MANLKASGDNKQTFRNCVRSWIISSRKRLIRENAENESEDEEDAKFSTLSMIANLKVLFYKLDLGAQLGEKTR